MQLILLKYCRRIGSNSYDELIQNLDRNLIAATRQMLLQRGSMNEAAVSYGDLHSGLTCRICNQVFEEGEVAGALACSHRFHQLCMAERYIVSPRCPTCDRQI